MPTVSILVKALNEERRIAHCLKAAVREAALVDGEVIVVDSLSTDRTVAIAQQFAVRIVQFDALADRGCGAAVQLGFQFAKGDFVYVLDGDMVLQPGFLALALAQLQADPGLAGVGGRVTDAVVRTSYDRRRQAAAAGQTTDQMVKELGGGGLYRVAAVRQTGYLAHRGLAAYEEAELGARLCAGGWQLLRLARTAVLHEGHAEGNWGMLLRLWRNGRAQATGAVLRAAAGQPWFWQLARKQVFVLLVPLLHLLIGGVVVVVGVDAPTRWLAWAGGWLVVSGVFAWRKRGLAAGLWALLLWHYFALAALAGLSRPVADPLRPIGGHELTLSSRPLARRT